MTLDRVKLRAALVADEGLRLRPYTDPVGKITIGVGRNLTDDGISATEAMALLDADIDRTRTELHAAFAWFDGLDDVRQRALVNMAFNLGLPRLRGFVQLLDRLEAGDYPGAAAAMLESRWASQVGARATRLAAMVRTGQDPA